MQCCANTPVTLTELTRAANSPCAVLGASIQTELFHKLAQETTFTHIPAV